MCFLPAPQATLVHSVENSLTNPMLMIAFFNAMVDQRVTRSLITRFGRWELASTPWSLNRQTSYSNLKGYLRYKTTFCHKVARDAQLMNFFIWRKNNV